MMVNYCIATVWEFMFCTWPQIRMERLFLQLIKKKLTSFDRFPSLNYHKTLNIPTFLFPSLKFQKEKSHPTIIFWFKSWFKSSMNLCLESVYRKIFIVSSTYPKNISFIILTIAVFMVNCYIKSVYICYMWVISCWQKKLL